MSKQTQIHRNVLPDNKLNGENGHNFKNFDYILRCLSSHDTKYMGSIDGTLALLSSFWLILWLSSGGLGSGYDPAAE
jgi:hypothetical protein